MTRYSYPLALHHIFKTSLRKLTGSFIALVENTRSAVIAIDPKNIRQLIKLTALVLFRPSIIIFSNYQAYFVGPLGLNARS